MGVPYLFLFMKSHQLINQDSGKFEYYTPQEIVEAARRVMGEIDLDPASSSEANKRVKTLWFFDQHNDGLRQEWRGRVWMNHPFGKRSKKTGHPGNATWINKLVSEFRAGRVTEFCCITFASTSEKWFQPLMDFAQCYLSPRTNYFLPDGTTLKGVTKGSVVTYGGGNIESFAREFAAMGAIKVKFTPKL